MSNSDLIRPASMSTAASVLVALCVGCGSDSQNGQREDGTPYDPSASGAAGQLPTGDGAGGAPGLPTGSGGAGGFAMPMAGGAGPMIDAGVAGQGLGGMTGASGGAGGTAPSSTGGLGSDGGSAGFMGDGGALAAGGNAGADGAGGSGSAFEGCEVAPITDAMRDTYRNMNDSYYEKYASANGVIVATGVQVGDEAIIRYCHLLIEMFSNDEIRHEILDDEMWFTMISENEQLSSLPQISRAYGTAYDRRARGLGGLTPTICAEDSIMCMPGDLWRGDCICAHETGHTMYSSGIARVPTLSSRLSQITNDVRASGRLANAYVWQDGNESGMMAWGVQAWYDCAVNGSNGGYHSDINTRAELQSELPEFYQLLSEMLPAENEYRDCYEK